MSEMRMEIPACQLEVSQFVYREARLLDEKRLDEWYDLFTEDARYWMPLTREQIYDPGQTSLFFEDKLLLRVRIERLRHPRAYSQLQPSFCQHVLQHPEIEQADPDASLFVTRTPFFYIETQLDTQLILAGVLFHHLTRIDGALRIRLKKIQLVNCDAALPSIQMLL